MSGGGYTIQYDETTTAETKKQMDLVVRYWSEHQNKIVVHYLESHFFGHAKADTVADTILTTLTNDKLHLNKLLCLASDGPNVNKAVAVQVNKSLDEVKLPHLIGIGMCNIHVVHNSFGKGIAVFGAECEQLAIDLFYWFKKSAPRREDFKLMQIDVAVEEHFLLRHVSCRWLSLEPALCRMNELWNAIVLYFTRLPETDKAVEKLDKYRSIMSKLKDPMMQVQLCFLIDIAPEFTAIMTVLQKEEPMIHLLHKMLSDFLVKLLLRFIKTSAVGTAFGKELLEVVTDFFI